MDLTFESKKFGRLCEGRCKLLWSVNIWVVWGKPSSRVEGTGMGSSSENVSVEVDWDSKGKEFD